MRIKVNRDSKELVITPESDEDIEFLSHPDFLRGNYLLVCEEEIPKVVNPLLLEIAEITNASPSVKREITAVRDNEGKVTLNIRVTTETSLKLV